jgi:hypothetical protein
VLRPAYATLGSQVLQQLLFQRSTGLILLGLLWSIWHLPVIGLCIPENAFAAKCAGREYDKKANWLPAPDGSIYMVMRLYWPKDEPPSILPPGSGTWEPPVIQVAQ